MHLCFIETTVFTKRVMQLGLEDELQDLQSELLANPTAGDTDAGTGGLRKVRMRSAGRRKGKRVAERARTISISRHTVSSTCYLSMAKTNSRH